MSTFILISVVCIFLATCVVLAARGFGQKLDSLDSLPGRLAPVNLDAIVNLLDPEQDLYLQERLRPRDLRMIRRERALVAAGYVKVIARNAAVLVRAAQLAAYSSDPELAAAGKRMGMEALQTRIRALQAIGKLYLEAIFPGPPKALKVLRQYESLDGNTYYLTGRAKAESRNIS